MLGNRAGSIARGELVGEPLAGSVEQGRALAADRLGDQQAVELGPGPGQRGRVELAELEIGEVGPRRPRENLPGADRPPGVGRPPPQGRGAARREKSRRGGDRALVGDHPVAALSVAPQRQRRGALARLHPRLGVDHRRQLRGQLVTGLAAAGMDDAAAGVPSLETERESSLVVEVELDAPLLQIAHRRRRLGDEHLDRRGPAEASAGGDRVVGVALR